MKEPKRYDFRKDGYTLQVLHTDSKYNKDKILKYLICEHYLLNNADSFRIFLSSCMNKSKDLSFMATKNEDQTIQSSGKCQKIHI